MLGGIDDILRQRVGEFLLCRTRRRAALRPVLRQIAEAGARSFLFGGVVRDLAILGPGSDPRDIDVVVERITPALWRVIERHVAKRTRFGGYELSVGRWRVDLWALEDTWAFRAGLVPGPTFEALPRTTFLNVQAAAVEILPPHGRPASVLTSGFPDALRDRTIDINLEDNPDPARCVVSALASAWRLGFALAPRLVEYILRHAAALPGEGDAPLPYRRRVQGVQGPALGRWVAWLRSHQSTCPAEPARLPGAHVCPAGGIAAIQSAAAGR